MAHSFAQCTDVECPRCGHPGTVDVWLIVDTGERPDLAARIENDTLHRLTCTHCDEVIGQADAPLLVFQPDDLPPLIFIPARSASAEQDQQQAAALVGQLHASLGEAWNDAWIAHGLLTRPRPAPGVRDHDSADTTTMTAGSSQQPAETPHLIDERVQAAIQANPWDRALRRFLKAETWIELYCTLHEHPELFSSEHLAQAALAPDRFGIPAERYALLARIQQVGVHAAFTELLGATQEELAVADAVCQFPPAVRQVLFALAATGIAMDSEADLQRLFEEYPAIRAEFQAALATINPAAVPLELQDDIDAVQQAWHYYEAHHDLSALDQAVAAWQAIVEHSIFPMTTKTFQATVRSNVANALLQRYWVQGQPADLEHSLRLADEAVQGIVLPDSSYSLYLTNLGNAVHARSQRVGQLEDLERAAAIYRAAVEESAADDPYRSRYLNNLADVLREHYTRTQDEASLEQALRAYCDALTETALNSGTRAQILHNLGVGLRTRYARSKRLMDLDLALQALRRAITTTSSDAPNLPGYYSNLGATLRARYDHIGSIDDLEQAIIACGEAVDRAAHDSPETPRFFNNLANALRVRYQRFEQPTDLEKAREAYAEACVKGLAVAPEAALKSARSWGDWASERQAWAEAARAYRYGIQALAYLYQIQLLQANKEARLGEALGLHARAAYALARAGQLHEAVVTVEQGRARSVSRALDLNFADGTLRNVDAPVYERYAKAAKDLRELEVLERASSRRIDQDISLNQQHMLAERIRQARVALDEAVATIRKTRGYEDFQLEASFDDIATVTEQAQALVYIVTTPLGGVALCVHAAPAESQLRAEAVWLNELSEKRLLDWLTGQDAEIAQRSWLGAYASQDTAPAE